ncbi:mannan endo-1,4-beta-mannosidase 8-like isoform X1 [Phoenix dactylifera]|uniref:mannan endo-1,4-beta-mannosidase n=1 Tax=Phoenix dactylifera TaxID=42345 RepID=A0A8B7MT44_PHODC|nr:mannan endo-1,4-beta-mannosidase 8-like isoform X1 [Phoenix dactylifera]
MATMQDKTIKTFLPFLFRFFFLVINFMASIEKSNAHIHDVHENMDMVDDMKDYLPFSSYGHGWTHSFDGMEDEGWGMVQRKGNQFVVGGQPFYFNGFNTYWLMIFAVDQSTRRKVTEVFQEALSVGYTVCRTWAFNDGGWRALQKSPSVYDEEVFKALDFVVSEARKYKIRLILSLTNNWEGYGGKAQYVKWGKAAGLNLTSDDDFFSDPTVKGYYKAHVEAILTRVNTYTNITYKDDPTIFAWELMNEPRCLSDPSGDKLQAWIQEMAFHVKSIDPLHLLEIGAEGFYGPSTPERLQLNPNTFAGKVGTDFIRNHRALGIDFASAHIYPDSWISNSITDEHIQFVKTWMQNHIDDSENVLGMPVIFGEFGVSSKDDRFNLTFRDKFITTVCTTQLNSTRSGGSGGGCLLWQLFPEGAEYMDDGYAVVPSRSPSTSSILSLHSRRLQLFNSRCSWRCHWGCRKKSSEDWNHVLPHDEL